MLHLPELIMAYSAMSPWARELLRDVAKDYVTRFPAPKQTRTLTLVEAGSVHIQPPSNLLNYPVDRSTPVLVRKPVDSQEA